MKLSVILLFIIFALNCKDILGQTDMAVTAVDTTTCAAHDTTTRIVVEKNACFQNGDITKFQIYVMTNIRMPLNSMTRRFEVRSVIKFTVDWDGQVRNVGVFKSSGYKIFDDEVVRVIKKSPNWSSAKIDNVCVPQQFILPVRFRNLGVVGRQN